MARPADVSAPSPAQALLDEAQPPVAHFEAALGTEVSASLRVNADYPWDDFDSVRYHDHNYGTLRDDDREILRCIRDFFAGVRIDRPARGIDVGPGANLYPALAMLPWCDEIVLWEYSEKNVRWLRNQIPSYCASWDLFWDALTENPAYRVVGNPREMIATKVSVHHASLFELPPSTWDIGTMFFVAESMSEDPNEFREATQRFVSALRPGAPFATAFMENSLGYDVGTIRFPAVPVSEDEVRSCLAGVATDVRTRRVQSPSPLRDGYDGMIVAVGRAGRQ